MYEPGSQYMEFVRRIPLGRPTEPQLLTFEPYTTDTRTESRRIHEAVVANDEPLDGAALDARLGLEGGDRRGSSACMPALDSFGC
ncbi:hypothetical protein IscW_ISCW006665 [Ixodes scapularis]|uniref:Uncharacterized protein n=1 Tax=Ixodes scapularis TaxID=6945 RepID=B7PQH5_IXOSC|nr:hypothetical protein IscW_ISCW006665 [Ixodes scapularis]|eukprot:XP_002436017.1 hypothetical protein IscW_ISCW006665 [Ixodes scapularis]